MSLKRSPREKAACFVAVGKKMEAGNKRLLLPGEGGGGQKPIYCTKGQGSGLPVVGALKMTSSGVHDIEREKARQMQKEAPEKVTFLGWELLGTGRIRWGREGKTSESLGHVANRGGVGEVQKCS